VKTKSIIVICIISWSLIDYVNLNAQILDLDSLFISKPFDLERDIIIDLFNISLVDGNETRGKWSLYDPNYFNTKDTLPSIYPLINSLRVIREQRFTEPLPFTDNPYQYMLSHFQNGGIKLILTAGYNTGGGNWINLVANNAFWDGRTFENPLSPMQGVPFYFLNYISRVGLLIHETRHSDPDDPGHVGNGLDLQFSDEGAKGRQVIYFMWVYKYGINNSKSVKEFCRDMATGMLKNSFQIQPPTHPNIKIQKLIDELLLTTKIQIENNDISSVGIKLYPIPVINNLIISFSKPFTKCSISIYSMNGSLVFFSKNYNEIDEIDMSKCAAGIYYVRISLDDKDILTYKVTKQ
jgi:hypothetical protein